jgi:nucleoside-diphosphate-sugar epimerase
MTKVLVTGATGFVGTRLMAACGAAGYLIHAAVRTNGGSMTASTASVRTFQVGDLGPNTDWSHAIEGVGTVIHLAGRAHVLQETTADPAAEYDRVNVAGALHLADYAAGHGVKRFIFVSSAKVHGDESGPGCRFRETDQPMPQGPYAASKWRAEQGLSRIADRTGLELVIVRPPLMYGPAVKANLLALLKLVAKPYILPFGGARNLRSLLYVDNLASFLLRCVEAPSLVREVFLLSDCDVSTRDLILHLRKGLNRPGRLVNVPAPFIRTACALTGRNGIYARLFGSLLLDSSKARRLLDWVPPYTPEEGLAVTARWFASCQE